MSYGKLRAFLDSGKILGNSDSFTGGFVNESSTGLTQDTIDACQKFAVDAPVTFEASTELLETACLLHERGEFKLPYKDMLLGIPFADFGFVVFLAFQDKGHIRLVWWMTIPESDMWVSTESVISFGHAGTHLAHIEIDNLSTTTKEDVGQDKTLTTLFICAVCLLHTKGIEKETIVPSEKQQKARLRRRKRPLDTVTVVRVQKHLQGALRGPQGERLAPRLHLRRGHYRSQHYGPGNTKTREIFIDPCLVGHEDQGTVTHDHYEVDEAQ